MTMRFPNPLPGSKFRSIVTSWASNEVGNAVVDRILSNFDADVKSNFFGGRLHNLFKGDTKMFEILSLGCFALHPAHFLIQPIPNGSKASPRPIDPSRIQFVVRDDPLRSCVRSATNEEMEDFVRDMNRRGIVSLLNQQYPGIDGIARFKYENVLYTMFVQVTIAAEHKFGSNGISLLKQLKKLAETSAGNKPHKCIMLWLVGGTWRGGVRSLDPHLTKRLGEHIDEYISYSTLSKQVILGEKKAKPKRKLRSY